MKHESIIVVYDSCQAMAEEIADMLGAETVSVQSVNNRHVESSQSFVLAVEYQTDGQLTPHCNMLFIQSVKPTSKARTSHCSSRLETTKSMMHAKNFAMNSNRGRHT